MCWEGLLTSLFSEIVYVIFVYFFLKVWIKLTGKDIWNKIFYFISSINVRIFQCSISLAICFSKLYSSKTVSISSNIKFISIKLFISIHIIFKLSVEFVAMVSLPKYCLFVLSLSF